MASLPQYNMSLPPTPPGSVPCNENKTSGDGDQVQAQQSTFTAPFNASGPEQVGFGFTDHRVQATAPPLQQPAHEQPDNAFRFYDQSNRLAPLNAPPNGNFESMGAPLLPPVRPLGRSSDNMHLQPQAHQEQRAQNSQHQNRAQPRGGMSATLDYNIDVMSWFIADHGLGLYVSLASGNYLADTDIIGSIDRNSPKIPALREWVSRVLSATRLPTATILTGLHFLALRMARHDQPPTPFSTFSDEGMSYTLLTVGLMLGSKFLDDNTFINRSWSEVAGIDVHEINDVEKQWLLVTDWVLHLRPDSSCGFLDWQNLWRDYERNAQLRVARNVQMAPVNANIQKPQHPLHHALLNAPWRTQRSGNTGFASHGNGAAPPPYAPPVGYDPWLVRRSENPQPSMNTGPMNPDYYGGPGVWGPNGFRPNRVPHRPSNFPPWRSQQLPQHTQSGRTSQWNYGPWCGHGNGSNCMYCSSRPPTSFSNLSHRMQSVMG